MIRIKFLMLALIAMLIVGGTVDAKTTRPLSGFSKISHTQSYFEGEVELFDQTYTTLDIPSMLNAKYPKLVRALDGYNQELVQQTQSRRSTILDLARQKLAAVPQYFNAPFYYNADLLIRRADSNVFSLISTYSDYAGGAHGMYGWVGVNFDAQTGRRLAISDVCTDADKLTEAILDRLLDKYDNRTFNNVEPTIIALVAEDNINFVLDPRGVTFIFNPYEIAAYASGLLTATIFYDERPELFKVKYRQSSESFAQALPFYNSTELELDGQRSTLDIIAVKDSGAVDIDESNDILTINLNGASNVFSLSNVNAPTYVHTPDGDFIYVDGIATADGFSGVEGECISVFKIVGNSVELIDRLPYTFRRLNDLEAPSDETAWRIITDPDSIQFDSAYPIGDKHSHFGAINSDGTFSFG